jgi:putative transposase
LMGLSRSTFYDSPPVPMEPSEMLVRISAICDEFERYGYRRVGAALHHQGVVVNSKKLRRLMRENDLQPTKDVVPDHPNEAWVADLT